MDRVIQEFEKNKYSYVENILSPEVTNFCYNYFILKGCTNRNFSDEENELLSKYNQKYLMDCHSDLVGETLLSQMEPIICSISKKNLIPSYSYTRLYLTGEELKAHIDRPSCQYSITLNLGGDSWPINFGVFDEDCDSDIFVYDKKVRKINSIVMSPGSAIVYRGEELVHWRHPLKGDHCVQVFLHYVDSEDEKYKEHQYDGRKNIGYKKKIK